MSDLVTFIQIVWACSSQGWELILFQIDLFANSNINYMYYIYLIWFREFPEFDILFGIWFLDFSVFGIRYVWGPAAHPLKLVLAEVWQYLMFNNVYSSLHCNLT